MHKFAIAVDFAAGLGLAGTGHAQMINVYEQVEVAPGQAVRVELRCPEGYRVLGYYGVIVVSFDSETWPATEQETIYVDGSGNPVAP